MAVAPVVVVVDVEVGAVDETVDGHAVFGVDEVGDVGAVVLVAVTFGGKWQVLPELPGRFDGIIWQGDRRGGRMVDELERMLEIDLWLLRWCKVDGFVRCSVGGAGAAPL